MARFINPKGTPISRALCDKYSLPYGARLVVLTDGDDTVVFEGPFTGGPALVVVGLGGSDTMYSSNNLTHGRYYSGYLQKEPWQDFIGNKIKWQPKLDKPGDIHVGPDDHAKGMGDVYIHGGNFGEGNEAWVWVSNNADLRHVFIPGVERVENNSWEFIGDEIRMDFDGKGYTARLESIELENRTPDNFVTDRQEIKLIAKNPLNGLSHEDTWVDFADASGPTKKEMQHFIDHWEVIV